MATDTKTSAPKDAKTPDASVLLATDPIKGESPYESSFVMLSMLFKREHFMRCVESVISMGNTAPHEVSVAARTLAAVWAHYKDKPEVAPAYERNSPTIGRFIDDVVKTVTKKNARTAYKDVRPLCAFVERYRDVDSDCAKWLKDNETELKAMHDEERKAKHDEHLARRERLPSVPVLVEITNTIKRLKTLDVNKECERVLQDLLEKFVRFPGLEKHAATKNFYNEVIKEATTKPAVQVEATTAADVKAADK